MTSMNSSSINYKRNRFPPQIIAHTVWLYARFNLSLREVEEMLRNEAKNVRNSEGIPLTEAQDHVALKFIKDAFPFGGREPFGWVDLMTNTWQMDAKGVLSIIDRAIGAKEAKNNDLVQRPWKVRYEIDFGQGETPKTEGFLDQHGREVFDLTNSRFRYRLVRSIDDQDTLVQSLKLNLGDFCVQSGKQYSCNCCRRVGPSPSFSQNTTDMNFQIWRRKRTTKSLAMWVVPAFSTHATADGAVGNDAPSWITTTSEAERRFAILEELGFGVTVP